MKKWETIEKHHVGNFRIFDLYRYKRVHPEKQTTSEFVVLDSPNWINIIPITRSGDIIFVEQYRHGTDDLSWEVPAGLIEKNEPPQIAAERECIEETGYCSESPAELLGFVEPNPAFLGNRCYHFLWKDCELKFQQKLDENELIKVHLVNNKDLNELIKSGVVRHSLVISALFYYNLKYGEIWNY